jgi:Transposase DDE domain group 1
LTVALLPDPAAVLLPLAATVFLFRCWMDFDGGAQSCDAGLLLLREAERKLGVCRRLAAAMPDRRDPDRILHAMFEMVTARSAAIASGYKDAIETRCTASCGKPVR